MGYSAALPASNTETLNHTPSSTVTLSFKVDGSASNGSVILVIAAVPRSLAQWSLPR